MAPYAVRSDRQALPMRKKPRDGSTPRLPSDARSGRSSPRDDHRYAPFSTSRPGHSAGRLMPKPPGSGLQIRPRAPHSPRPTGMPPEARPLRERDDSSKVTVSGTNVKRHVARNVTSFRLAHRAIAGGASTSASGHRARGWTSCWIKTPSRMTHSEPCVCRFRQYNFGFAALILVKASDSTP